MQILRQASRPFSRINGVLSRYRVGEDTASALCLRQALLSTNNSKSGVALPLYHIRTYFLSLCSFPRLGVTSLIGDRVPNVAYITEDLYRHFACPVTLLV